MFPHQLFFPQIKFDECASFNLWQERKLFFHVISLWCLVFTGNAQYPHSMQPGNIFNKFYATSHEAWPQLFSSLSSTRPLLVLVFSFLHCQQILWKCKIVYCKRLYFNTFHFIFIYTFKVFYFFYINNGNFIKKTLMDDVRPCLVVKL